MAHERLLDLVNRHFEGRLTPLEVEELNALLAKDPEARATMVRAARHELALSEAAGRSLPTPKLVGREHAAAKPHVRPATASRWRRAAVAGIAASVLIAFGIWRALQTPATLRGANGDVFKLDEATLTLTAQSVVHQRLDDAGRRRITLERGAVRIDVTAGAGGILVETPEGLLEDIGTDFVVTRPSAHGPTTVRVVDGEVRFSPSARGAPFSLLNSAGTVALRADGSIGTVRERRGTLQIRPRGSQRYSLAEERTDLEPGDLIRTGTRGAHAGKLLLSNGTEIVLGPHTQIELMDVANVRLITGDAWIAPGHEVTVAYTGPNGEAGKVQKESVLTVGDRGVSVLAKDPEWLIGYRSDGAQSLGSLLAEVDGRNVPLEMGYHKVVVDVQDQIARTVIEESFKNNTDAVLEGSFYFPLPAKASISGFAMWIGDELVEGEIVEKQRAREIFETLLREKKDPGLLEWTGGNIFKARVYPIFARSEKRIKITYTEVLESNGTTFRYFYPLKSDLTRQTPLRQLEVLVRVASTRPITAVECPTHSCRLQSSTNEARIEFSQSDYVADRDFEVRVTTAPDEDGVTAVSHRRDGEGYVLLLMDGPKRTQEGRNLLPDARPQDIILLLDTSHSVRGKAREQQIAFVEALLLSLGPKDTLQLATIDTDVRWLGARENASPALTQRALAFHDARFPLGWTNLEGGMTEAMERSRDGTHIVYVGDGIHTATHVAPTEVLRRLREVHRKGVRVHSVSVGNEKETRILEGLATLGSGTARGIDDSADPATVASDTLASMVRPGLENVTVRFLGAEVAAQHPSTLPNLAEGGQAFLLARFDPALGAPTTAILEGRLDGKPVHREVSLDLDPNEEGNSFLPRLWARKRLDYLLDQGSSKANQEKIIALSERFQIITPYTSFLVLENDADRERFKLEQRLKMRDGEQFFASVRTQVDQQLAMEQIQLARQWRLQQRRSLLRSLESLGRRPIVDNDRRELVAIEKSRGRPRSGSRGEFWDSSALGLVDLDLERYGYWDVVSTGSHALLGGGGEVAAREDWGDSFGLKLGELHEEYENSAVDGLFSPFDSARRSFDSDLGDRVGQELTYLPRTDVGLRFMERDVVPRSATAQELEANVSLFSAVDLPTLRAKSRSNNRRNDTYSLASLFPGVPSPSEWFRECPWPTAPRELMESIDRRRALLSLSDGLRLVVRVSSDGVETPATVEDHLVAADGWWSSTFSGSSAKLPVEDQWILDGQRCHVTRSWLLGRRRAAVPADLDDWGTTVPDVFNDFGRQLADWNPQVVEGPSERRTVVLTNGLARQEFEIDRERAVLLEHRGYSAGRLNFRNVHADFVRVGKLWFPRVITSVNEDGTTTRTIHLEVTALDAPALAAERAARRERLNDALLLDEDQRVDLLEIRTALASKAASLTQLVALFDHHASLQQFDGVDAILTALNERLGDALGAERVRLEADRAQRLNQRVFSEAKRMAAALTKDRAAATLAARDLLAVTSGFSAAEQNELIDAVRPLFVTDVITDHVEWINRKANVLRALGREADALAVALSVDTLGAANDPAFFFVRVSALTQSRRTEEAIALLRDGLTRWTGEHRRRTFATLTDLLEGSYRISEAAQAYQQWTSELPKFTDRSTWSKLLSLLIKSGRLDEAEAKMVAYLSELPAPNGPGWQFQRIGAALDHLLVSNVNLEGRRFDPALGDRLLAFAEAAQARAELWPLMGEVLAQSKVTSTTAGKALAERMMTALEEGVATLPPAKIARWYESVLNMRVDKDRLTKLRTAYLARFDADGRKDPERAYVEFFTAHGTADEQITLFSRIVESSKDAWSVKDARAHLVFMILRSPFSTERESMLLAHLPLLEDARAAGAPLTEKQRVLGRLAPLQQAFDWMEKGRVLAATSELTKDATVSPNKRKEAANAARKDAASALAAIATRLIEKTQNEPLIAAWLRQEVIYRRAKGGEKPAVLAPIAVQELRQLLADYFPSMPEAHALVVGRALEATLALSVDESTLDTTRDEVVALLDTAVKNAGDRAAAQHWARDITRLALLAFDRREALRSALTQWFDDARTADAASYGTELARLLVDDDNLETAVSVLEKTQSRIPLSATDLTQLSQWRLALNRKEAAVMARRASYEARSASDLYNELNRERSRYTRSGENVPEEIPDTVPERLTVLIRKDPSPVRSARMLANYYGLTRDFRIVDSLVGAMKGMSERSAYALCKNLHFLLDLIQDEATVDRFAERIAEASANADEKEARVLAFLHALVRFRAADQQAGARPHVDATLSALALFDRDELLDGEAVLRSSALRAFERCENSEIRERVLMLLAKLHASTKARSDERFSVAFDRASMELAWGDRERGIEILRAALDQQRSAEGGALPAHRLAELTTLVAWLRAASSYPAGERLLEQELERDHSEESRQTLWLALHDHRIAAVGAGEALAAGSGKALYQATRDVIDAQLAETRSNAFVTQLIPRRCQLIRSAKKRRIAEAEKDLVAFAYGALPAILNRFHYFQGQSMVSQVAAALNDVASPLESLRFLVTRGETEPSWLRWLGEDFWSQHGWTVPSTLHEVLKAGTLEMQDGNLDQRLLTRMLAELEEWLTGNRWRSKGIFDDDDSNFWRDKREEFRKFAVSLMDRHGDDERLVMKIAGYLADDLSAYEDAIRGALSLQARRPLMEANQFTVCRWLVSQDRHLEAEVLLRQLVERSPLNSGYARLFAQALFGLKRHDDALSALVGSSERLKEASRLSAQELAQFAQCAVSIQQDGQAATWYSDAITSRVNERARNGRNDWTLSSWHQEKAKALIRLKRFDEAIDAAAGGVVVWSAKQDGRTEALRTLNMALAALPNPKDFIAKLDRTANETGRDTPILRRGLANALLMKDAVTAATQARLALLSGPPDPEVHRLLVDALKRSGQNEEAALALRAAVDDQGRTDLLLVLELASLFTSMKEEANAERALTTLVELKPQEAEGHTRLAEQREKSKAWSAADAQWAAVAELDPKNPAGLIGRLRSLIPLGSANEAREVLAELNATSWDERFNGALAEVKVLEKQLNR